MHKLQAILFILAQKFLKAEEMDEIKEEINMTYLGQLIFDDGVKAGIEKGREEGILVLIRIIYEYGAESSKICDIISREYQISKEKAEEYLEKFLKMKM